MHLLRLEGLLNDEDMFDAVYENTSIFMPEHALMAFLSLCALHGCFFLRTYFELSNWGSVEQVTRNIYHP